MIFKYIHLIVILLLLTSCGMSEEDKKDKTATISYNLNLIVDSLFSVNKISKEKQYWHVNYHTLKKCTSQPGKLQVNFSFQKPYGSNPREYYEFEGVVFVDDHNLQITKNDSNKYLIEMNVRFHGDDGEYYTTDKFFFPNIKSSTSKSSVINEFNKPESEYFRNSETEKNLFLTGMSENDKAIALLSISQELNERNCVAQFNGNWLEIKMQGNVYPIDAGTPETACRLIFENHENILKYCTGVRLFKDSGMIRGAYRNPHDKYSK